MQQVAMRLRDASYQTPDGVTHPGDTTWSLMEVHNDPADCVHPDHEDPHTASLCRECVGGSWTWDWEITCPVVFIPNFAKNIDTTEKFMAMVPVDREETLACDCDGNPDTHAERAALVKDSHYPLTVDLNITCPTPA